MQAVFATLVESRAANSGRGPGSGPLSDPLRLESVCGLMEVPYRWDPWLTRGVITPAGRVDRAAPGHPRPARRARQLPARPAAAAGESYLQQRHAGCGLYCRRHRRSRCRCRARARRSKPFLCLITPMCSYLYGGLYGGLYERAHIIRYFPSYTGRGPGALARGGAGARGPAAAARRRDRRGRPRRGR